MVRPRCSLRLIGPRSGTLKRVHDRQPASRGNVDSSSAAD